MKKFRVYVQTNINIDDDIRYYNVPNEAIALLVMDTLTEELLLINSIESSIVSLEMFDEELNDWIEWEDEEGHDLCWYSLNDNFELVKQK